MKLWNDVDEEEGGAGLRSYVDEYLVENEDEEGRTVRAVVDVVGGSICSQCIAGREEDSAERLQADHPESFVLTEGWLSL